MKKIIFRYPLGLAFSILIVTICLSSCKKSLNDSFEETIAKYAVVGTYHEEGLNYILDDLKEHHSKTYSKLNLPEMMGIIESSSADFTANSLDIQEESVWQIKELVKSINIENAKLIENPSIINMVEDEVLLTIKQTKYLSDLDGIISCVSLGIDQCVKSIERLELEICQNCQSNELPLLLCATSVGKSSIVYWYKNYYIWEDGLVQNETKTAKDREWFWSALNRMGKADIAGGLLGGAFGALAGGVGAIPGAIAGACQSSGTCGVVVLYEHLAN